MIEAALSRALNTAWRIGDLSALFPRVVILAVLGFGIGSSAAWSQTVLERVLSQIQASGVFVNAAQSDFGNRRGRIDASITNLVGPGPGIATATGATQAIEAQSIALGMLESVAFGATNAGDVFLSVEVSAGPASNMADAGGLGGIPSASIKLLGENAAQAARLELARIDDLVALSQSVAFESWQTGTRPDATVAVMNLAANSGNVNARILTQVEGAVLDARNAAATAIGVVNGGIVRVIGDR